MIESQKSFRYWVVSCLGCRNLIPLFAEAVDSSSSATIGGEIGDRPYFRAWCMECGREYPYLSEAMTWTHEPPLDKHHRQLEFTRMRPQPRAKGAHA